MNNLDTYETPWLSIPVPRCWTVGRQRGWIWLRCEASGTGSMKIQSTSAESLATDEDVRRYAASSQGREEERLTLELGEYTGLRIMCRPHGEERLILRSGRYLLFVHLLSDDLDSFRPLAFDLLRDIKTKEGQPAPPANPRKSSGR